MSVRSKDSDEAASFLSLFSTLRDWTDDDPEGLVELSAKDETVRSLSGKLYMAADLLNGAERGQADQFTSPVDPTFLVAWRDYEARYAGPVSDAFWFGLLPDLADLAQAGEAPQRPDLVWDLADSEGQDAAKAIEEAVAFTAEQASQDHRDFPEDYVSDLKDGVRAWAKLRSDWDFDLRGVFRRRQLVPFVLVPRHVAARIGKADRQSVLGNLREAQHAFVFGAPHAALAMMRSILESVLRDHYGASGGDLDERIRSVRHRLPPGASEAALHRLRKRANAVLHLGPAKAHDLPPLGVAEAEKELVSLLLALRALIEGAPLRA